MSLPKYEGPLAPVPPWLDPSAEVGPDKGPRLEVGPWLEAIVATARERGLSLAQAFEVAAIFAHETGWGRFYRAWNLGGVKATQSWAAAYRARTGKPAPYWRAKGNKGTGDSKTVIYRAYASLGEYVGEWLGTFVPRLGSVGEGHRYRATGEAFWRGEPWVPALIEAGYRGRVTRAKPQRAIEDHAKTVAGVRTRWAQSRLGVTVDGAWGPRSRAALAARTDASTLDDAALAALAA